MNKPVAWKSEAWQEAYNQGWNDCREQFTHPVKELHLSLQKEKETEELLAVTYTDDEHRIVEVLWQRPPVKELTDEEIIDIWYEEQRQIVDFARAILRKAQENG